jgi:hypothetical protein
LCFLQRRPSGKSAMPWLSVACWSFPGCGAAGLRPGGGSLWGSGLGPLYALDKLVRACASSPKISWGGHQILPSASASASFCARRQPLAPTRWSRWSRWSRCRCLYLYPIFKGFGFAFCVLDIDIDPGARRRPLLRCCVSSNCLHASRSTAVCSRSRSYKTHALRSKIAIWAVLSYRGAL